MQPAIAAERVSFKYGDRVALDAVSFRIERGEIFGFLGPNGGGKTTLFRILSTLTRPHQGRVEIFGLDPAANSGAIRRKLGVVFQNPSLDGKLTVRENLQHHGHLYGISGRELRDACDRELSQMAVADRSEDLVDTLSGGLRRRAELAKSLLHRPELLLLDEPSTGLDPGARRDFNQYLAELRSRTGVTIVVTTHYLEEAECCDRIGILDTGKLVAIASPRELKERIGGDVISIIASNPQRLAEALREKMSLSPTNVGRALRIEAPRGHELVHRIVDEFGAEIESITFGKPTLEDAFIKLTGHRFYSDEGELV